MSRLVGFDVMGTAAYKRACRELKAHGFKKARLGSDLEIGMYDSVHSDAAPGFNDWMYEILVREEDEAKVAAIFEALSE